MIPVPSTLIYTLLVLWFVMKVWWLYTNYRREME